MDTHLIYLTRLCRICTGILPNAQKRGIPPCRASRPVANFSTEIKLAFNIDISEDAPDCHPTNICLKCIKKLRRAKKDESLCSKYRREVQAKKPWSVHPRTMLCSICQKMETAGLGGNKRAKSKSDHLKNPLPFYLKCENIFSHHQSISTASTTTTDPKHLATEDSRVRSLYTCNICKCILKSPVQCAKCEHTFCSLCLSLMFQQERTPEINCPTCNVINRYEDIVPIPLSFEIVFRSQLLKCAKCESTYPLPASHTCPKPSPSPAAALLTSFALQHQENQPIPEKVSEAVGAWVGVMLQSRKIVELKTNPVARKVSRIVVAKSETKIVSQSKVTYVSFKHGILQIRYFHICMCPPPPVPPM